jgi:Negative regulator of sigma F
MEDRQVDAVLERELANSGLELDPALRARITSSLADLFTVLAAAMVGLMGTAGWERMTVPQLLGITALLASGVCLLALLLAWQMRPGSYRPMGTATAIGAFGVGLLTGMALLFPWGSSQAFVAQGWPCLASGLGVAIPGVLLLWLLVRRGAPLSFPHLGASLGATAGLLGVTVLQFHCPHQEALHLLAWHGSILLIATAIGVFVGLLAERLARRA